MLIRLVISLGLGRLKPMPGNAFGVHRGRIKPNSAASSPTPGVSPTKSSPIQRKQGPDVGTIRRMPLTNGQTFAGYTIIRLLGSGGMGEVYLAEHPRLPRRDALKLLPQDWSADADYRARFNREADLASTLWHPHIVGVHDRGEEGSGAQAATCV
jgi:serine/threonine protein kinase